MISCCGIVVLKSVHLCALCKPRFKNRAFYVKPAVRHEERTIDKSGGSFVSWGGSLDAEKLAAVCERAKQLAQWR